MSRSVCSHLFTFFMLLTSAQGAGIINPSFENPVLSSGGFQNGAIPGWSGPTAQSFYFGVTAQIASLPPVPSGNQAAFVNNFGTGGGSPTSNAIAQQLTDTLQPSAAYVLSASFGWRNDNAESIGRLEIWCGGTVSDGAVSGGTLLASKNVKLVKGQFVRDFVTFKSLPPWNHVGEKLSVRLVGTPVANGFAQTDFDDVQLLAEQLQPCQCDINRDGLVNDLDFQGFVVQYNALICDSGPDYYSFPFQCSADLNFDGLVDDADFVIFLVGYDNLDCPSRDGHILPVSQSRSVSALVTADSDQAFAPDFGPFSGSVSINALFANASARQNSSLGEFAITIDHEAAASGSGNPEADSEFTYVFDIDNISNFSLQRTISAPQVTGSLVGPTANIDLSSPGLSDGLLWPGRYTLKSHCRGGAPGTNGATMIQFNIN